MLIICIILRKIALKVCRYLMLITCIVLKDLIIIISSCFLYHFKISLKFINDVVYIRIFEILVIFNLKLVLFWFMF